jgi:hypothetical protein
MLFDAQTGKVIEENAAADPSDLGPTIGQHGFMPGMEPAAIQSIMRAPAKIARPTADDEGEIFRGQGGSTHDPRDAQDGGWEDISANDISYLARLGYRGRG